jgi:hypothetical protein
MAVRVMAEADREAREAATHIRRHLDRVLRDLRLKIDGPGPSANSVIEEQERDTALRRKIGELEKQLGGIGVEAGTAARSGPYIDPWGEDLRSPTK